MNMEAYEAKVNVTYKGQNGDLPDPVNFESTNGDVLGWVAEAIHTGSIPGINADPTANLADFVVDRFASDPQIRPYNLLQIRPKTPFG
jgi:hypothetical protein